MGKLDAMRIPQSGEEIDETIAQETMFSLRCASQLQYVPIHQAHARLAKVGKPGVQQAKPLV